ncbi:MAG: carbohydrate-binding family 9-like protein [Kiritimatiellae bacterium]|nr:carbohydrate-binding family 9-like protein [Kiritimatiellia bacterium]
MKLHYTVEKISPPTNNFYPAKKDCPSHLLAPSTFNDSPVWKNITPLTISNYMGAKLDHFPVAQAKLAYDDDALYVIFRVEDNYVQAVAKGHQAQVCSDSCVEFFFTPSGDISSGYFNLEINCGGTALFHHQTAKGENCVSISEEHLDKLTIAHSLPTIVDPEIQEPVIWTVEYRLPTDILSNYAPTIQPAENIQWQANFYKCADHSSHPHWLTWSPIDKPNPDFHRPEYFGTIGFDNEN